VACGEGAAGAGAGLPRRLAGRGVDRGYLNLNSKFQIWNWEFKFEFKFEFEFRPAAAPPYRTCRYIKSISSSYIASASSSPARIAVAAQCFR